MTGCFALLGDPLFCRRTKSNRSQLSRTEISPHRIFGEIFPKFSQQNE
jgi:hypothetical protein